jgi:DNA-packaging protein gp3
MPAGRPPKYNSPKKLQKQINAYFAYCDAQTPKKPYTVLGLCVFLGILIETLNEYQKKEQFSASIRQAKQKIEGYAEELLYTKVGQVNGIQFSLKHNFHWKDQSEVAVGGTDTPIKTESTIDLSKLPPALLKTILDATNTPTA